MGAITHGTGISSARASAPDANPTPSEATSKEVGFRTESMVPAPFLRLKYVVTSTAVGR